MKQIKDDNLEKQKVDSPWSNYTCNFFSKDKVSEHHRGSVLRHCINVMPHKVL